MTKTGYDSGIPRIGKGKREQASIKRLTGMDSSLLVLSGIVILSMKNLLGLRFSQVLLRLWEDVCDGKTEVLF